MDMYSSKFVDVSNNMIMHLKFKAKRQAFSNHGFTSPHYLMAYKYIHVVHTSD